MILYSSICWNVPWKVYSGLYNSLWYGEKYKLKIIFHDDMGYSNVIRVQVKIFLKMVMFVFIKKQYNINLDGIKLFQFMVLFYFQR